jgi:hypothetical protein
VSGPYQSPAALIAQLAQMGQRLGSSRSYATFF